MLRMLNPTDTPWQAPPFLRRCMDILHRMHAVRHMVAPRRVQNVPARPRKLFNRRYSPVKVGPSPVGVERVVKFERLEVVGEIGGVQLVVVALGWEPFCKTEIEFAAPGASVVGG